jgi:arylsulfatase A-like enzyme
VNWTTDSCVPCPAGLLARGRRLGCTVPLLAALLLLAGCGNHSDRPRDLILVTIDTLRADELGCYGSNTTLTPHLDRLSRMSATFGEVRCAIPITGPSHATIMSGLSPAGHGVHVAAQRIREEVPTLATVLAKQGYANAAFISGIPLMRGSCGLETAFAVYGDEWTADRTRQDVRAEDTVRRALAWLVQTNRRQPVFLWVHLFDPHTPYEPPLPYGRIYLPDYSGPQTGRVTHLPFGPDGPAIARALYRGEITYADYWLGRLLAGLAAAGRGERGLVVVTADHGESFDHDYYCEHAERVYDSVLRVPLLIEAPRVPGRVVQEAVQLADLFPTALALLSQGSGLTVEGKDCSSLVAGQAPPFRPQRSFFAECLGPLRCVVEGDWKLIRRIDDASVELYDLAGDPGEAKNLAAERPQQVGPLQQQVMAWQEASSKALSGVRPELKEEDLERLKALGYVQ